MTLARGGFVNTDNVRAWLNALPTYRQCRTGTIVVDADGTMRVDAVGAACDVMRRHGEPVEVEVTADRAVFRTDPPTLPHCAASIWLGVDLFSLRVRVQDLPGPLHERVDLALCLDRIVRRGRVDWTMERWHAVHGFDVMDLSDRGVSFPDLADALRVTLGVDEHLVGERAVSRAVAS